MTPHAETATVESPTHGEVDNTATCRATATTTRTVVSRRARAAYIISHRRQDDTGKVLHRTDGPAHISVYRDDGDQHLIILWYDHGTRHRTDGPAGTSSDGSLRWTDGGIQVSHLPEHIG